MKKALNSFQINWESVLCGFVCVLILITTKNQELACKFWAFFLFIAVGYYLLVSILKREEVLVSVLLGSVLVQLVGSILLIYDYPMGFLLSWLSLLNVPILLVYYLVKRIQKKHIQVLEYAYVLIHLSCYFYEVLSWSTNSHLMLIISIVRIVILVLLFNKINPRLYFYFCIVTLCQFLLSYTCSFSITSHYYLFNLYTIN